jgi:hypothetical protein
MNFDPPAIETHARTAGEVLLSQDGAPEAGAAAEQVRPDARADASLRGLMQAVVKSGDTPKGDDIRARRRAVWRRADQIPQESR